MQKILVTGGAGFVGSNIANMLADKEQYRVVVCDMFGESEKWQNINKHMIFEIISPVDVFYWLEANAHELEAVLHMGAVASSTETNVDLILEHNFSLSKLLWHWCAENEKRFIYASAAATYGDGSHGFDDDISKEYLAKLKPLTAFGWSKWLFDQFVASCVRREEKTPPQWVGLKFFNLYGPNEYHKEEQRSVVHQVFPHAHQGGAVRLFKSHKDGVADGHQQRDFIYIKDLVKVVQWLLDTPSVSGIYNLGSAQARTFEDMAKALFSALGKEPRITYYDMPEAIKPKYQYFTEAKMDRLRAAGYTDAFMSLEEGIADYVQHYLVKEDPYY